MAGQLSHLDQNGKMRMVDVGEKRESSRLARARSTVLMTPATAALIASGKSAKGDVAAAARLAGIQAAKRTDELIPLAHQIALTKVGIDIEIDTGQGRVEIVSEARTRSRTGVEMEALVACSIAALTVYDMVKGVERGVTVESIELLEKKGGKHDWVRGAISEPPG